METIISIDDFSEGNIELAKLIKSYGLESRTIFFIDLGMPLMPNPIYPYVSPWVVKQIKELSDLGFQVGGHGKRHDNDLKNKSYEEQKDQIFGCKKIIEDIIGKPCEHFAYCRGRSNEQIRQLVKEAGYLSGRNTTVLKTDKGGDLYNMPTTFHLCPVRKEYGDTSLDNIFNVFLNKAIANSGYFHYWLHVFELDKYKLWDKFEEHLQRLSKLV